MKPNKQKTDWDFNGDFEDIQLGVTKSEDIKNRRFITSWLNRKRLELLTRFDTQKKQLLLTQREEIIKVIKEHRPVFFKGDLHSLLSQDEVMRVREVLRIEILEELGVDCKEIRERLKQITNLKEK